ncbi:hypothetical protein BJ912DRAFT_853725 [Pholiota molesta]|nr:hypothetical protein BJ912DRAFT_853725 [Pholiota molesta]
MASWLRIVTKPPCTRHAPARHYSDAVHRAASNKWQLAGVPRPRSILDDDDAPVDLSEDSDVVNGLRPGQPPPHLKRPPATPTPHEYKAHRATLRKAFPAGWSPPRKLSRQAMDALRDLHRADPDQFRAPVLADRFKISPEAVRRILKSKWAPSAEKQTARAISERRDTLAVVQERENNEWRKTSSYQKREGQQRNPKNKQIRIKHGESNDAIETRYKHDDRGMEGIWEGRGVGWG